MILFYNLVCICVHMINEKSGGCKSSFSWLGQSVKDRPTCVFT